MGNLLRSLRFGDICNVPIYDGDMHLYLLSQPWSVFQWEDGAYEYNNEAMWQFYIKNVPEHTETIAISIKVQ